jgi:hypothetical protein
MKKVSWESPSRALIYIYQYLLKTCLQQSKHFLTEHGLNYTLIKYTIISH